MTPSQDPTPQEMRDKGDLMRDSCGLISLVLPVRDVTTIRAMLCAGAAAIEERDRLKARWERLQQRVKDAEPTTFRHRQHDDSVAYTPYRVVSGWMVELARKDPAS